MIPPPVDVGSFSIDTNRTENQLVIVGRLEKRKRPKIAVDAMRELPEHTLKLVGDGPLRGEIERSAPSNVDVLGYVDDSTLRQTIEESIAGIFLAEREDFGITPIEYMAAGTPVVGVNEPNTNNQIDQETGILVKPTLDDVIEGIQAVTRKDWDRQAIRETAEEYSAERFRADIQEFVEAVYF